MGKSEYMAKLLNSASKTTEGLSNKKVTISYSRTFDIPDSCSGCPALGREQDMNATIEYCKLKHNKRWVDDLVTYKKGTERFRDKDCPLKPGGHYEL